MQRGARSGRWNSGNACGTAFFVFLRWEKDRAGLALHVNVAAGMPASGLGASVYNIDEPGIAWETRTCKSVAKPIEPADSATGWPGVAVGGVRSSPGAIVLAAPPARYINYCDEWSSRSCGRMVAEAPREVRRRQRTTS